MSVLVSMNGEQKGVDFPKVFLHKKSLGWSFIAFRSVIISPPITEGNIGNR